MRKMKTGLESRLLDPSVPPIPANEAERIACLKDLRLDLSLPYDEIQGLCELAAEIAGVPIALVSLVDETHQRLLASVGLGDLRHTTREVSFCAHAIMGSELFEITNTSLDDRFAANPFVVNDPKVRSYLGTILEPEPEKRLGTLCVLDTTPRIHSETTKVALYKLGKAITALLVSHREKLELIDYSNALKAKNTELSDLTDSLQNSTTKLVAAEKSRSEFLSTVSHELRTPLTSIKGALSLMKLGEVSASPEKYRHLITIANENSDRLLSLVNDILQLQKTNLGKSHIKFVPVDLAELIENSADAYRNYAADKNVTLRVRCSTSRPCVVRGDKSLLDRVMGNLISNAFKFSNQGGQIEIELNCPESGPQITVKDHGVGIPKGSTELVFGMFKQVDNSDTRTTSGTGLGMHLCRQILTQHDATIGYTSVLGEGTTFIVNFKNGAPKVE
ncbi:GAF domain-containing sensor histidine kinase [Pacificibacter marinus]|uniref:GAF domain-containing sensor histidine kinase n=1 Tax=Pacificibacter marinus TaxID=658057 RepID=UPI001C071813|nr:GAF domain-containing sensor histidine kinase [Pacificibacter marinus]MBU2868960.1 GAF domain-containing sensor histidine kinase [Pacificibacter marinus]